MSLGHTILKPIVQMKTYLSFSDMVIVCVACGVFLLLFVLVLLLRLLWRRRATRRQRQLMETLAPDV